MNDKIKLRIKALEGEFFMKTKLFISGILSLVMLVSFAGCNGEEKSIGTDTNSTETSVTDISVTSDEAKEEVSFLEKCKLLMTELAPSEVLTAKEGVEYPTFQKYTYYSNTAKRDTPVNVLLPKDYSEDKQYPVLYILHGYYDNQDWMTRDVVKLSIMYQNLLDSGEIEEMIIVCPYIFCSEELQWCTGMDTQNTLAYDNFINDMFLDLIPFIEENFSVSPDREDNAITGFSMGGREALFIGFKHPEKFAYIGGICPAPGLVNGTGWPYNLEPDEFKFTDIVPKLVIVSSSNSDGVVGSNPATYVKMMADNNIEHLWHNMQSTGHDHSSVTPALYNFMRMIFKG